MPSIENAQRNVESHVSLFHRKKLTTCALSFSAILVISVVFLAFEGRASSVDDSSSASEAASVEGLEELSYKRLCSSSTEVSAVSSLGPTETADKEREFRELFNQVKTFIDQKKIDEAYVPALQGTHHALRLFGDQSSEAAGVMALLGQVLFFSYNFEGAKRCLERSVDIFQLEHIEDRSSEVEALYFLARSVEQLGDLHGSEKVLNDALDLSKNSFGVKHKTFARMQNAMAELYHEQSRFAEAEDLYDQSRATRRELLGAEHPDYATSVNNIAVLHLERGQYQKAEPFFHEALKLRINALGPQDRTVAMSLNNLAELLRRSGRYEEARDYYLKALVLRRQILGERHPDVATSMNTLGLLYDELGRLHEAEKLFRGALRVRMDVLGLKHARTANSMNDLALLYRRQGKYHRARELFEKALEVRTAVYGDEHPYTASFMNNVGLVLRDLGLFKESEEIFLKAHGIKLENLGELHPSTATSYANLGHLYSRTSKQGLTGKYIHEALRIRRVTLGDAHPDVALSFESLAQHYQKMERFEQAEGNLRTALEIYVKSFAPDHPNIARTQFELGSVLQRRGEFDEALTFSVKSMEGLGSNSHFLSDSGAVAELVRLNFLRDTVFPNVASSLLSDGYSADQRSRLLNSSFMALQRINGTSVGADIVQASARAGEGDAGLAALVERLEEASIDVRRIEAELEFAANLKASTERDERLARLKGELETATKKARGIAGEIREDYPDYAELALPQGLSAEDVGALLGDGEAVVSYAFVGKDEEEFLLAIVTLSDGSLELFKLDVTKASIEERVSKLREGVALPSGESFDASTLALDLTFDMSLAEELYGDLFRPLEEYLGASDHVIVVADGPLESLPFNLLVRSQAPSDGSDEDLFSVYRDAAWLIDRYAISSVPSISSLKALRDRGSPEGDLPFLGIGHPSLEGKTQTAANDNNDDADVIKRITLGLGDTVDVKRVKELSPVPQTAGMLQALATALNADGSHVLLQDDAEERDLRALEQDKTLKEYQTIAFGTHALIARELRQVGLNEPALVLSPPANDAEEYDPNNDGLLRASEVVGLTLDADWVLLTACNTAAPDGTLGAEPLTGLAKSFFYAGARSLLVSHWPAEATATARLAPAMIQETNHGSSKAQALRQAMRQMKQDTTCGPNAPSTQTCPENAHPALWATFTISGDAG